MSTSTEFVTKGILKYLSQSAMFMGAACVAVALPAQAKTERQVPAKVAVKQSVSKAKAGRGDEDAKASALKKATERNKPSMVQVKHVKGLAKPNADDEDDEAPRGKKLKVANAKAARAAKADNDEEETPVRKGKAALHAKADKNSDKADTRTKLARKGKAGVDDDEDATPKTRKLSKAERIKAERQARLDAEEEARQERLDAAREKRLVAQRKAKEEAAEEARQQQIAREKRQQEIARVERQQEQARQKRMVAARQARERALMEDRAATQTVERAAAVREVGAAVPAVAAPVAMAVASTAAPAPVSYVPAAPAPMVTPVAAAPAPAPAPVRAPEPVRTANLVSANSPLAGSLIGSQVEERPRPAYVYRPNPSSPVAASLIAPEAPVRTAAAPAPVARSYVAQSNSPVANSLIATPATPVRMAAAPVQRPEIVRVSVPANDSLGQIRGMSTAGSPLALNSAVAFVMDQNSGDVLLNKNGGQVSPIASITKLMTAVVTMDASLPMDERITITYDDVDRLKGSSSRLSVGSTFTRQELLHLALMSSENRAAHALGRTYPGGMPAFVRAMNMRATMLGMRDTNYVEPTGLNSGNQSSARDLALLARAAYRYPLIRSYTTHPGAEFDVAGQTRRFNNTNRLVHSSDWNIGLQKTGYISEAGRCVVMQSNIDGRNVIIVLLDSNNSSLRVRDAESIRYWVQNNLGRGGNRSYGGVVARAY